jgi:hypothetical protein
MRPKAAENGAQPPAKLPAAPVSPLDAAGGPWERAPKHVAHASSSSATASTAARSVARPPLLRMAVAVRGRSDAADAGVAVWGLVAHHAGPQPVG